MIIYRLLFPVDKIFKNLPDFLSIKRLNNVNYMKFEGDSGINSLWNTIWEICFYREYNEDDLLLIEVFKLFLPGYYHHPTKRVELDKNGKGIKILKFKTADEFAIYCIKQGGIYSARDRDCIPIEELRGRQAFVILKDKDDEKNKNENYLMSFSNLDYDIEDMAEPMAISDRFR